MISNGWTERIKELEAANKQMQETWERTLEGNGTTEEEKAVFDALFGPDPLGERIKELEKENKRLRDGNGIEVFVSVLRDGEKAYSAEGITLTQKQALQFLTAKEDRRLDMFIELATQTSEVIDCTCPTP